MSRALDRRDFLRCATLATAGAAARPVRALFTSSPFDLVVRGGLVLDGTGAAAYRTDIGIVADTIEALGSIDPAQGRRVLDAAGLHVAPGFIDIHTHSDDTILRHPGAESRVLQGITTEVTGNCGSSAAPRREVDPGARPGGREGWSDVTSYLRAVEETAPAVNQALLLGQGTLRRNVVGGDDRPATPEEMASMRRAVEEGMEAGAWGLSTGLEYAPGIFTPTAEIGELAELVVRRGGLYASHMRNEEAALLEAVDEAIAIGRRTGVAIEISHLKAAGRPNWHLQEAALERLERARDEGVDVLADAYPYTAYSTGLKILLPAWARDGGRNAMLARLADAATRGRIAAELPERIAADPGSPELVRISSVQTHANRRYIGRTLAEVAAHWQTDAARTLIGLLRQENGVVGYVGFAMSEDNVDRVLAHPLVMIGSDGVSVAAGPTEGWRPHPRCYGTCARVLGRYARQRGLFDLPTAVAKMSSMPADRVGLRDRGRIATGKKADLVLFDARMVADRATFEEPYRPPDGIRHVLVNGEPVVADGAPTGTRPGQVLRR